jgi:alkylhydroperoxidase/carboxymuconolactone decarboxylase family protein YurZ
MATGKLASLIIKISANGAEAEKTFKKLERKVGDFGKKMKEVGTTMSTYITAPVVAAGAIAVRSANQQLQAESRLLTALKGRKEVQDRLIKQAAELQSRTIYGDEVIIEQQAFLAALGLTEQQIGSTINAAIQLSAALGIDLNSAVRNLAKTYSGLAGELGESIPALRNLTAEEMKAGGAIAYVNDNYKGFAETAAQTGMGPLQQLKNTLGDLAEQFGTILVPIIQKLATRLKEIAERFQQLSPRTREVITTVAAIAAATGPLLVAGGKLITGLKTVIALLPALGAALTTLAANPIGATVAGLSAIALALASIRRESNALGEGRSQGVQTRMTEAYNLARKMYENASDAELQRVLAEYKEMLNREGNYYASASGGRMTQAQVDSLAGLQSTIKAIEEIIAKREDEKRILDSIKVVTTEISVETAKVARDRSKIDVSGADLSALTTVGAPKEAPLQMMLNNFNSAMWREKLMAEAEKIAALNKSIGAIIESSVEDVLVGLGEGIGNLISGTNFDPLKLLLNVLGNMLQQLGKALMAYAVSLEAVKTALKSMNPWLAGVAGVAAIAAGTALINLANKPVKLATGGLAYGPTLAVVGDNPGASSDPEVVAPLSKLRNYIGGQRLELVGDVTFELSGDKLRATLNRENVRLASLA